jgi:hypothetical protein
MQIPSKLTTESNPIEPDRIYSCLVAAELNGEIKGHLKALKNFFLENDQYRGREVFYDLSADYGSFKRAIDIEEVKKYLVLWRA